MSKFLWISSQQECPSHLSSVRFVHYILFNLFPSWIHRGSRFPVLSELHHTLKMWRKLLSEKPPMRLALCLLLCRRHRGFRPSPWTTRTTVVSRLREAHRTPVFLSQGPSQPVSPGSPAALCWGAVLNRKITTRETEKNIEPNRLPKGCSQELSQESRVSPCWPRLRTHTLGHPNVLLFCPPIMMKTLSTGLGFR